VPRFWKLLNRHISVKNYRILMKFGLLQQILNLMTVKWPKIKTFIIQDGGWPPSLKSLLDITKQIFAVWSRIACQKRSGDIKCKFWKSNMADGCYFEIVNAPHLNQNMSDFDEIWCGEANSDKDDSHFTNIENFPNSRRQTSAMSKECFGYNSAPNYLIFANFV